MVRKIIPLELVRAARWLLYQGPGKQRHTATTGAGQLYYHSVSSGYFELILWRQELCE